MTSLNEPNVDLLAAEPRLFEFFGRRISNSSSRHIVRLEVIFILDEFTRQLKMFAQVLPVRLFVSQFSCLL